LLAAAFRPFLLATSPALSSTANVMKGKPVWAKARPQGLGKPKPLSAPAKGAAKKAAKAAGRPYPNLVDNMRAARKKP
jgi:hypothetical protein